MVNYHETAFAHCGGCDSRQLFPSACVHISLVASCSQPFESALRERGKKLAGKVGRFVNVLHVENVKQKWVES